MERILRACKGKPVTNASEPFPWTQGKSKILILKTSSAPPYLRLSKFIVCKCLGSEMPSAGAMSMVLIYRCMTISSYSSRSCRRQFKLHLNFSRSSINPLTITETSASSSKRALRLRPLTAMKADLLENQNNKNSQDRPWRILTDHDLYHARMSHILRIRREIRRQTSSQQRIISTSRLILLATWNFTCRRLANNIRIKFLCGNWTMPRLCNLVRNTREKMRYRNPNPR